MGTEDVVENTFRGVPVMLDRDLAIQYKVATKALNQAVKRNARRFPERFMFQLTNKEFEDWKSHIVASNVFSKEEILQNMSCSIDLFQIKEF